MPWLGAVVVCEIVVVILLVKMTVDVADVDATSAVVEVDTVETRVTVAV